MQMTRDLALKIANVLQECGERWVFWNIKCPSPHNVRALPQTADSKDYFCEMCGTLFDAHTEAILNEPEPPHTRARVRWPSARQDTIELIHRQLHPNETIVFLGQDRRRHTARLASDATDPDNLIVLDAVT